MVTLVTKDFIPPEKPVIALARITRGSGPVVIDGRLTSSDCAGMGSIVIRVASADDMTPIRKLGYRFSVVGGSPPAGFFFPKPYRAFGSWRAGEKSGGTIWFHWEDDDTNDQEAFKFACVATCLDGAGNESEPCDTLWISDKGRP